jgi:Capsular polysaccharide biosynthesis protein
MKKDEISLREIFNILKKHLVLILLITCFSAALGYVVSQYLIAPEYQANATLIVNPDTSEQNINITYDQVQLAEQLVGTYSIILKSDPVLEQVIDAMDLDMSAPQLAESVTVAGVNQTSVIQVTVRNKDPKTAMEIANKLIDVAPPFIINAVKAGSVEIISHAKENHDPVSPNILMNTMIMFAAGLILSCVIAYALELLNNRVKTDEDIQNELGYNVIGIIPNYSIKLKG